MPNTHPLITLALEDIELLKRIRSYLSFSPLGVQAVYKTPAQELREAADREERKESDLKEFDNFISSLQVKTE